MFYQVSVTQEDIDKGRRNNCYYCPIARALARVLETNVSVGGEGGIFLGAYSIASGRLPSHAISLLRAYDGGLEMEPFSFSLELWAE